MIVNLEDVSWVRGVKNFVRMWNCADYSRLQTELAESRMGEEEASLNNKQKKKIQVKECDNTSTND